MGFELVINYVDGEEAKTMKKKVGDPYDDISMDKLAAVIMAQLASMALKGFVIKEVELYEYAKKKINFKQSPNGIIIKSKKFSVNDDAAIVMQDIVEEGAPETPPAPPVQVPMHGQMAPHQAPNGNQLVTTNGNKPLVMPHNNGTLRPIKWVVFSPEPHQLPDIKQKGLRLTPDKKYPVFAEKEGVMGINSYLTVDDLKREITISDIYFVPGDITLVADRELGFTESPKKREGGTLMWSGVQDEGNMPDIRRR